MLATGLDPSTRQRALSLQRKSITSGTAYRHVLLGSQAAAGFHHLLTNVLQP